MQDRFLTAKDSKAKVPVYLSLWTTQRFQILVQWFIHSRTWVFTNSCWFKVQLITAFTPNCHHVKVFESVSWSQPQSPKSENSGFSIINIMIQYNLRAQQRISSSFIWRLPITTLYLLRQTMNIFLRRNMANTLAKRILHLFGRYHSKCSSKDGWLPK